MSARVRHCLLLGLTWATVVVGAAPAGAEIRGDGDTGSNNNSGGNAAGGVTPQGRVFAVASLHGGVVNVVSGGGGSAPSGPVCQWRKSLFNEFAPGLDNPNLPTEIVETGTDGWYYDPAKDTYVDAPGPGIETLYWVQCPNSGGRYLWVPPSDEVDHQSLIDAAYQAMYSDLPTPSININPRPEVGTVVNVGVWLAVDDPGEVSAVAEVGPVWAVTSARFAGMTWDMGNGDSVDCAGLGVPYPAGADTFEQGPCGYTYTEKPPPEGYTVTVSGRWKVQLRTSGGINSALSPIAMPYSFGYDVDEIITVGVTD